LTRRRSRRPRAVDPHLGDAAVGLRQALEDVAHDQAQERQGPLVVLLVLRQRLEGVAGPGDADVPAGGAVEVALGADLVQRDDQQQPPQLLAGGHLVVPSRARRKNDENTDWTMSSASTRWARSLPHEADATR